MVGRGRFERPTNGLKISPTRELALKVEEN